MTKNTRDRILDAALELFLERGYQGTSIARIETKAGLVPRAGAFYRHFDSKRTVFVELAKARVSESPEEFGLGSLADFGDTRAELVAIALKYEEATARQEPFEKLIVEMRDLDFGDELQTEIDRAMIDGLAGWLRNKNAAAELNDTELTTLLFSVLGGWLYYLSMVRKGSPVRDLRDALLDDWASRWATILDA